MSKSKKQFKEGATSGKNKFLLETNTAKPPIWFYFVAAFLAWIAFYPALQNGFLSWDDTGYLHDNSALLERMGFSEIFTKFPVMGNYHPLTIFVYSVIYQTAGLDNASAYHLVNLLLHIANVLLVIRLTFLLFENNTIRFFLPLLFAIHPLKTESVVWISETKDVLYVFFYLLALLQYVAFVQTAKWKNYLAVLIFFLLSCLSKGMAVTFSAAVFVIDCWLVKKVDFKSVLLKVPLFAISLFFGVLAFYAQKQSAGFYEKAQLYNSFQKVLIVSYSFSFYIVKMVIPYHLGILYPYPKLTNFSFEYYLSLVLVISYVGAIYYFRKNKILFGGLLFYAFVIFPVLQLIPVGESVAFDRYFYLSSFGLFVVFLYGIDFLALTYLKLSKNMLIGFLIAILLIFTWQSNSRATAWHDNLSLWGSMIETNPDFDKSYYAFGEYYQDKGDSTNAFNYYRMCLERNPSNKKAQINIGNCYYNFSKNEDLALKHYQLSLKADSNYYLAYLSIGNMLLMKQQLAPAEYCYKRSIELDSTFSMTYYNLALLQFQMGKKAAADSNLVRSAHLGYQMAIDILAKPH